MLQNQFCRTRRDGGIAKKCTEEDTSMSYQAATASTTPDKTGAPAVTPQTALLQALQAVHCKARLTHKTAHMACSHVTRMYTEQ